MSVAGKTVRRVSKQVYYLTVAVCFVFLLMLLAAVWLSNAVSERKDEAAQWLSQQVGYPVNIGEAELYFLDFFPKLHLRNVHILDSQKSVAVMSVNHIYLDIDLIASLSEQQPVLNTMNLSDVSLQIKRNAQGEITVRGLDKIVNHQSKSEADDFSLPVKAVDVQRVAVKYTDDNKPILSGNYILDNATFNLEEDSLLSVRTSALLPRHLGQGLALNGSFQLSADTSSLEQWEVQINANNLSLTSWSLLGHFDEFEVTRGLASVRAQLSSKDKENVDAKGRVELSDVTINSKQDEQQQSVVINQLTSSLTTAWSPQQWSLTSDSLLLNIAQQQWPETKLNFLITDDGYRLQVGYLNIANMATLAKSFINNEQLLKLQPTGEVTGLEVDYSKQSGLKALSAKLNQLAFNRTEKLPGISGLTADLQWDNQVGFVEFDSQKLTIDALDKLPEIIEIATLSGKASLEKTNQDWLLVANELFIKNDDLTLTVDGTVSHVEQKTVPDMHIILENIQVAKWKNYVPVDILSDDFREWSDEAFRAGKISNGTIDLSGDLAEFPFIKPEQKGDFKMVLAVTGMQLDYGVGWPQLYNVDASIIGDGKLLAIESQKGRIADFAFNKLRTEIDNYLVSKPVLTTKGRIDGTTQKALTFLKNSPLEERFGQIATSFSATGDTSIVLDLTVPLTNVNSASASGSISFKNSQLISDEEIDIQLEKVNGLLLFDGDGVTGNKLSAQFLEQPINIDVLPAKGSTLIEATGEMPIAKVYEKWPDLRAGFISGKAPFKTTVSVIEQKRGIFDLDVNVASELVGVIVDAPPPFGKKAEQTRDLSIHINEHKNNVLAYRVNYADVISTYLLAQDDAMHGEIRLGSGKAKLAESGLSLKGQLEQVDLATWQNWQGKQPAQENVSFLDSLDVISLNIDQADASGQSITNIAVMAEKAAQEWRVNMQSDQVKGRINLPLVEQSDLPFVIDLDYLYLKTSNDSTEVVETKTSSSLWPSIQFNTKRLDIDQMKLGAVSLSSRQLQNQWVIDKLTIQSGSYQAEGNGVWQQTGDINKTQLNLTASSDDLKAVLADFGYQQAIEAKGTELDLKVNWLGQPTDLSLAKVNGTFDLKVGSGKLVDVEPGAAGRIFGLMSITAIPRRLTLDFSDLFSKGFNFNSITGTFNLADGIADTSNLVMAGEAARIEVKGPIDLVEKSYNQSVKVTPNVSSTLPVAGAVAGGPVGLGVGAAILLVDKIADNLFGKEIVNLVSYSYKLSGPWTEPELTTLQAVTE